MILVLIVLLLVLTCLNLTSNGFAIILKIGYFLLEYKFSKNVQALVDSINTILLFNLVENNIDLVLVGPHNYSIKNK
jgi:hypothetical protein